MKRSRFVVPAVVTATVVGCLGIGPLGTAATAGPAAATVTAKAPVRAQLKHSPVAIPAGRWAAGSPRVAEVRRHQAAPARPAIAHLAPQLNRLAGVPGSPLVNSGVRLEGDGSVEVTVTGPAALAAAKAVGARTLASFAGSTTVALAPGKLRSLAGQPGVGNVAPAVRAMPQAVSEGVVASGAQNWAQSGGVGGVGNGGAGVKVGIVDLGFKDLQAEIDAGNFDDPDGNPVTVVYPDGQDHCLDDTGTAHGTAVSEIVHQMAPRATLYLYCIDDNVGFSAAAGQVVAAGVRIVNSSLAFTAESRGDGYGPATSSERAVKAAREAGVLWIQSSGNGAQDHWSGSFADANADHLLDLQGLGQADEMALEPGSTGNVVLSWDRWPASSLAVTLAISKYDDENTQLGDTQFLDHVPGDPPVLELAISNTVEDPDYTGGTHGIRFFDVLVLIGSAQPAVHYDLYYGGEVSPSFLSGQDPSRAAAGSVLQPASSPWALAVGAAYRGDNALEAFSSRGPTADGRIKPDLLGFDGVSSDIGEVQASQYDDQGNVVAGTTGFYGTSAAAPHVAGAAALVAAANPAMDASDIEAFLQRRADPLGALPTNKTGYGLLALGDPAGVAAVAGSRYFPLGAPRRIADTRSGLGVRKGPMVAGTVLAVPVPSTGTDPVPANATSVVLSLSGAGAQGSTYLAVYSTLYNGNSTLNLSSKSPDDTVTAVVKLNSGHGFLLRNSGAATHAVISVLGYFGAPTAAGGLGYVALPSRRLLDTRIPTGIAKVAKLAPSQTVTVNAGPGGVPTTATAAVVNMTALNRTAGGYLTAYPSASPAMVSLDYRHFPRSSLVVLPLVQGRFVVQNRYASTDLMIDVVGYFSPAATARFVALPHPRRIVDTRTGTGGRYATMTPNAALTVDAGGLYGVPYQVSGLWVGLAAVAAADGYLTIYPKGTGAPHAVNLNFTAGQVVPNAGIATLSPRTATAPPAFSTVDRFGASNVISDAYGYFVAPGA